ncbi:MAG: hypothetical protein QG639_648 [Patescibacteria group bacterium]|nr:hypothetical protein [Patescibacteria group bacterium]
MNRETVISQLTSPQATNVIDSLRNIFKDLPHLPLKVREILAQIIPWLAIVGAVFSAIGGIQDILIAFNIGPTVFDYGNPVYWLVIGALNLVAAYVAFLSFPLLKERNHTGWVLLFWGAVLSVVMSALSLFFNTSLLFGFVVSTAISFYLTFEIESMYTATGKVAAAATNAVEKTTNPAKTTKKSTK